MKEATFENHRLRSMVRMGESWSIVDLSLNSGAGPDDGLPASSARLGQVPRKWALELALLAQKPTSVGCSLLVHLTITIPMGWSLILF